MAETTSRMDAEEQDWVLYPPDIKGLKWIFAFEKPFHDTWIRLLQFYAYKLEDRYITETEHMSNVVHLHCGTWVFNHMMEEQWLTEEWRDEGELEIHPLMQKAAREHAAELSSAGEQMWQKLEQALTVKYPNEVPVQVAKLLHRLTFYASEDYGRGWAERGDKDPSELEVDILRARVKDNLVERKGKHPTYSSIQDLFRTLSTIMTTIGYSLSDREYPGQHESEPQPYMSEFDSDNDSDGVRNSVRDSDMDSE